MSKKGKGKPARKTAPRKVTSRRTATKASAGTGTASTGGRTAQATIFIFRTGSGTKIRTAPQKLFAGPGFIEWTVVNLVDGSNVPVTLTWPNGGPWGKEPVDVRDGMVRKSLEGAKAGVYKYVVQGLDAQEDPEVEIPEM
jgi:hypothetical protein